MFLPDVNVWLALGFGQHIHHLAAKSWFESIPDAVCAFCRLTQQGFLRLATNPKVFGDEAVSLEDAWHLYDALATDPRVVFADEPPGLEQIWRAYTQRKSFTPNAWSDAYLAAFARTANLELVTFDQGFGAYQDLACRILA